MKLKPLGDRLIVMAVEEEETTASGIVLPDTAKEKPQRGKVLAVGDGKVSEETVHFLEQIYGRQVQEDDTVTIVRFSAILERPEEISERLSPGAPAQN